MLSHLQQEAEFGDTQAKRIGSKIVSPGQVCHLKRKFYILKNLPSDYFFKIVITEMYGDPLIQTM